MVRRWWTLVGLAALAIPAALQCQSIRGRVTDPAQRPLTGALVELRDLSGHSLKIVITSPTGAFQIDAPAAGRYLLRFAAIGFQPKPPAPYDIPADGVHLPDVVLRPMALRLPDLVSLGHKFCGKTGIADETFDRILESAHSALQIMEATVSNRQIAFQVGVIHTRTVFGGYNNVSVADTVIQPLSRWPVQSIDPDTLRLVGFGRTLTPGDENTREYYGPDARVLFSDWFLDSHCFTVDKPKKNQFSDSLHLRFAPAKKGKLVDIVGELVLDAHNLALLQMSFTLRNLPGWMPDEAAGGQMEFAPLPSGLWMTKSWTIWAPIGSISPGHRMTVGGQVETYGFVTKVYSGSDSSVVNH